MHHGSREKMKTEKRKKEKKRASTRMMQ